MKQIVKILLWVVGIVLALLIVLSLLAGPIAKGYVNRHGEQLVGRHTEVKGVGVNLLTGSVKIKGLTVFEDDGRTPFAGFDTLDVRAHLLALAFKTVNLRHITLAGLKANVVQDGDRFNFSSLIEHFKSDKPEEEKDTTPSEWTLKFYNIRISHAQLSYNDLRSQKSLHVPDLGLQVPGFVLGAEERTEGGLHLTFDKGGRLSADADYDATQGTFAATVALTDFALRNVEGYVQDIIALDEVQGLLDATVRVTGSTRALLASNIGADLTLRQVALNDEAGQLAGLDNLEVKVNNINLDAKRFDIANVHLDGLKATYEQWEDYSNLSRLLKKKEQPEEDKPEEGEETAEAADTTASTSKPMELHVGQLLIENCAFTYVNHTLPEEFRFPVTGFTVAASDLTTTGENNARVRASLPGGGHLAVRWQGNISQWKQHQDLFLTIKGLDMRQLSPWALAYTGQPIEEGILGLTSRNSIDASQLKGQNTLDIYKATVGKRRTDVDAKLKLPLKAALYVLKDKDDKILIDLPVKGDIDNPEFNYMKLVWKTLGNLIVKVATSPARALAGALGANGEGLDFIAVDPAQHSLTSEQYHTLGQLATIAQSDSLMTLILERQMPPAGNDTVARRYEMRDRQVLQYLGEQGLEGNRVRLVVGDADSAGRYGYAVSSEIRIDE